MLATTGKQSLAFGADVICAYSGPFFSRNPDRNSDAS